MLHSLQTRVKEKRHKLAAQGSGRGLEKKVKAVAANTKKIKTEFNKLKSDHKAKLARIAELKRKLAAKAHRKEQNKNVGNERIQKWRKWSQNKAEKKVKTGNMTKKQEAAKKSTAKQRAAEEKASKDAKNAHVSAQRKAEKKTKVASAKKTAAEKFDKKTKSEKAEKKKRAHAAAAEKKQKARVETFWKERAQKQKHYTPCQVYTQSNQLSTKLQAMGRPHIGFHPNTDSLNSEGKKKLHNVYQVVKAYPAAPLTVSGYTTLSGKKATSLVQGRAKNAANYLQSLGLNNKMTTSDNENVDYIGVIVSVTPFSSAKPTGCK